MRIVRLILHTVMAVGVSFALTAPLAHSQAAIPNPARVAVLKMTLRDLYVSHVFWVRSLVIATRLGERTAVAEADVYGVDNAETIGESIAPFYGEMATKTFTELFANHYLDVKRYMRAAFANNFKGDETFKRAAAENLTFGADQIALFMSSVNPTLPRSTVHTLLTAHIGHHVMAINATAKKDWSAEAAVWNPMVRQVYVLSDTLVDGIARQVPEKFR
jgi:hypothetical protein